MHLIQLQLALLPQNLALDEALLELAIRDELPAGGVLRFWETAVPVVVVGRATKIAQEVNLPACRELGVTVFRRATGGTSIVAGPGCLMYAIVGRHRPIERLEVNALHAYVQGKLVEALATLGTVARPMGTSDVAIAPAGPDDQAPAEALLRKVSGNALRITREAWHYHGTLLYDFDLQLVERCLLRPPREPAYREGRSHGSFLANLNHSRQELETAVAAALGAYELLEPRRFLDFPGGALPGLKTHFSRLCHERYESPAWNFSR